MPNPSQETEVDLPDDFFADLADEQFIDKVIENGGANDSDDDLKSYINEINRLQNDIQIRKRKIKETEANLKAHDSRRQSRSRSRSRSNSRSKRRVKVKTEKRRRSRSPDRSRRSRSPICSPQSSKHSRFDEHNRDKRYPLSPIRGRTHRRSRSISPIRHVPKRSTSTHRNISFLEELAQKFAEKGQAFPERDALLMGGHNQIDQSMEFGNMRSFDQPMMQQPMIPIPNFPQQQQQPIDFGQPQNMFYGINPMSIMAGNSIPQPAPFTTVQIPHAEIGPIVPNPQLTQLNDPITSNNQKALISRCEQAIKLIRAKDNRVPVMKFLYNKNSMVVSNDLVGNSVSKSPLQIHSVLNASFKLNATSSNQSLKNNGLKMLPKRVKDVAQSLGINSEFLFDRMRTKELNAQITDQIIRPAELDAEPTKGEILIQTTTNTVLPPIIETTEIGIQTTEFKCTDCTERNKRIMVNSHSQTFIRGVSIGVQTNEKDYREPIVELLSRMTAAQLVAIKDFANIVDEPRPRDKDEMYRMRERLIDIYNLSQRDADVVHAAEENRMDEGPFMEQSYRGRGDMYDDEGSSRDFNRRSNSPRFNGNNMGGRNFESNNFGNDRSMMEDRQRFVMEDRFRGDGPYSQRMRNQDDDEEMQRKRYLEMERQRELELEITQRRYEEQRLEQERLIAMRSSFQTRQMPTEDEMDVMFRDREEREMPQRQNIFNSNNNNNNNMGRGGTMNRRGRGAFRDNFRGGRGSRR